VVTAATLSQPTVAVLEAEGLPPQPTPEAEARLRSIAGGSPSGVQLIALAEVALALADRMAFDREASTAHFATAAFASWSALFSDDQRLSVFGPQWLTAQTVHNAALSRLVERLPDLPGKERLEFSLQLADGPVDVEYLWGAFAWSPAPFSGFVPADDFRVRGLRNRNRQAGLGAAILGERASVSDEDAPLAERRLPNGGLTVALSAVINDVRFPEGRAWPPSSARLVIADPARHPVATIRERRVPVQADFTAALAQTIAVDNSLESAGLGGLRNVTAWEDRGGLFMLEPFDPERIPVIFVHGLVSSPVAWREMVNDLWSDAEIRARYQFWLFMYPSGNPFALSAVTLRRELAAVRAEHDPSGTVAALDQMVLVGHSMGGLLSRRISTEPGDSLWRSVSDVPFDEIVVEQEEDRVLLRDVFIAGPAPGVRRVVFIATPHRGSVIADFRLARLVSGLINLPPNLVASATRVFEANSDTVRWSPTRNSRVKTGIESLSPNSKFLLTLAEQPIAPGITAHSIIGRRSGGDEPGGSDGVVPYVSSHLPFVESELIIAGSDHSVPLRPEASREVLRILRQYLREVDGARPSADVAP
jgi:triacylglycerol esterase/lipase EstA (alpha/beta hydrolase family)